MMIFGCAITDCGSSLVSTHTLYAFLLTGFPVPRYLLAEQKMPNAIRDPRDMEYRSAPHFAIIGCGLAGKKRAAALPPGALQVACDSSLLRAEEIARRYKGCRATDNSKEAITDPNVDVVIVSTPHAALGKIALSAVRAGKHVLVEKPGAINSAILKQVEAEAAKTGSLVRIGFNHRYHPAFQKAYALVREEALGPPMFIRGRYGHGGRIGLQKEWRGQLAGGAWMGVFRLTSGRCPLMTMRSSTYAPRTIATPGSTQVTPSGRTYFPSKSISATPSCTLTELGAAMGPGASIITGCDLRWAPRIPLFSSSLATTRHGSSRWLSSRKISNSTELLRRASKKVSMCWKSSKRSIGRTEVSFR